MTDGRSEKARCPCGDTRRHTCSTCARPLCTWHNAGQPFADGQGGVELAPVCFPACDSPWWLRARENAQSEVRPA